MEVSEADSVWTAGVEEGVATVASAAEDEEEVGRIPPAVGARAVEGDAAEARAEEEAAGVGTEADEVAAGSEAAEAASGSAAVNTDRRRTRASP